MAETAAAPGSSSASLETPSHAASAVRGPRSLPLLLPFALAIVLAGFGLLPQARQSAPLLWTFSGGAVALLLWCAVLLGVSRRAGRALRIQIVVRQPHWVQPIAHLSIFVYWGSYWPEVPNAAHLIASQLVLAYAFDMLLAWSRRDVYQLGFGPFPIVFSVNLFLWFKPEWFYLQFVMLAAGFATKEFIRWNRNGRSAHIFNPSAFPLALAAVVLLATGNTPLTFGSEIATTLAYPPHIYLMLALTSLPGQILFGVAIMTAPALLTAFTLSAIYFAFPGTYYFFGTIPTPVFLGMLLLFTDPATAPRSELGRVMFGALYGAAVFTLYGLLELAQLPTFYDKLLAVPLLNLSVRAIDRLAARIAPRGILLPGVVGPPRNLIFTGMFWVVFAGVHLAGQIGDTHVANRYPFWRQACVEGRRNACRNSGIQLNKYCRKGAGWACNELGALLLTGVVNSGPTARLDPSSLFRYACGLGYGPACANQNAAAAAFLTRPPPSLEDYNVMLDDKLLPEDRTGEQVLEWSCAQGWAEACTDFEQSKRAPTIPFSF